MYEAHEALRDALADIEGVKSCKIGLEANISPADFPMIRLIPTRIIPGSPYNNRTCETLILFADNVTESQGLELVYETVFKLEAEVIKVAKAQDCRYIETTTDEDSYDLTYKAMVVRVEVRAERPVVS